MYYLVCNKARLTCLNCQFGDNFEERLGDQLIISSYCLERQEILIPPYRRNTATLE